MPIRTLGHFTVRRRFSASEITNPRARARSTSPFEQRSKTYPSSIPPVMVDTRSSTHAGNAHVHSWDARTPAQHTPPPARGASAFSPPTVPSENLATSAPARPSESGVSTVSIFPEAEITPAARGHALEHASHHGLVAPYDPSPGLFPAFSALFLEHCGRSCSSHRLTRLLPRRGRPHGTTPMNMLTHSTTLRRPHTPLRVNPRAPHPNFPFFTISPVFCSSTVPVITSKAAAPVDLALSNIAWIPTRRSAGHLNPSS
mmetsp:Transcript_9298/g.42334  ORF Transcript_9298/g.42334 Transcript_9298/m.42334 type:complete len:258 (+) Transcript_9298:180-953(+)